MSRVSRNILFNLIGQGAIVVLGFWGTRLVFSRLGDEALGILYFALAVYAVLTPLLDMGVSSTVVREVARYLQTDPEYVVRLTRSATLFYWLGYAVLGLGVWFTAPWLVSHWIKLEALDFRTAVHGLRILALALLLMFPRSLYANLLRGVERMEFNNLIEVATSALHQGGTIAVVLGGGGLVAIAYCYLGSLLLSNLAYMLTAAHFFSWRALLPGYSSDVLRQNSVFAYHMAAFTFFSMIQMESDKALVSKLLPLGLVGFYGVAQTMVARISRLPGAINQAAFPNFSSSFHKGDHLELMRQYRRLQDLIAYGMVPVFAAVIFASQPLFTYLLDFQAAQILRLPTALLCLAWYMNATLTMPFVLSLAAGRADISARQNLYALFVVLPVSAVLIWKWGLVGAGLSVVAYHLFAYTYGVRRIASECMSMRPQVWYFQVATVLALASATYGSVWLILMLSRQHSIPSLTLGYVLGSVAYLSVAYRSMGQELQAGFSGLHARMSRGILRALNSN